MRDVIGMEIPLSSDHYGHFGVNSGIKLARAMEKWNLAWMEDILPWQYGELLKQIKDSTTTPVLTGEDIYLKEDFIKLIDMGAVDMIHPDLASSGGLIETKKIGDYAMEHGVAMAMHFAGSPISYMANVHCAAATENFIALEHHSLDVPWWEIAGHDDQRQAAVRQGICAGAGQPRSWRRAERRGRQGAPATRQRLLRADARSGTRSASTIGCGARSQVLQSAKCRVSRCESSCSGRVWTIAVLVSPGSPAYGQSAAAAAPQPTVQVNRAARDTWTPVMDVLKGQRRRSPTRSCSGWPSCRSKRCGAVCKASAIGTAS